MQIYTEMGTHVSINALTRIVMCFFKLFCFVCHKLYKAKKNYLNSHVEEATGLNWLRAFRIVLFAPPNQNRGNWKWNVLTNALSSVQTKFILLIGQSSQRFTDINGFIRVEIWRSSLQNRSAVYHPFLRQMKRECSLRSDRWRSWKLSMNSKIPQTNFWDTSFFGLLVLREIQH